MFIQEACQATGLTKKAIGYYCEQGLLAPGVFENGYRTFSRDDVVTLQRIAVLRKLNLTTQEISAVLADTAGSVLRQYAAQAANDLESERRKLNILQRLSLGAAYTDIHGELEALERETAIGQRLIQAFPPHFGRFLTLHFSRFLALPAMNARQQDAYRRILEFLDETPSVEDPQHAQEWLAQTDPDTESEVVSGFAAQIDELLEDPHAYIQNHRQALERMIAIQQSDAYRQSPAYELRQQMRALVETSGYRTVFLPMMKQLSPAYAAYAEKLTAANQIFLSFFPNALPL